MKRTWKGAGSAAGVLALVGGLAAAGALPAAAAQAQFNTAFTAASFGLISHKPIAEAEFPGDSRVEQRLAVIPGLLATGGTENNAGPTSASSVVTSVRATRLGGMDLTAAAVASACRVDFGGPSQPAAAQRVRNSPSGDVAGSTFILTGKIAGSSGPIMLPTRPAPNTRIAVQGGIVLWLNKQVRAENGTLTVAAIYASLRGGAEHLAIGVSTCSAMNVSPSPSPSPSPTGSL
jgi:hypothetical protein